MIERKNKMKLYFYILDSEREFNSEAGTFGDYVFKVRVEECEVIEKPKTYKPVTKFPAGIYVSFIRKESIGNFISEYSKVIVLDAPDYEKAKEVFLKKYDNELNALRKRIDLYEEIKSAVEVGEENCK
jgi:hypothetical protein